MTHSQTQFTWHRFGQSCLQLLVGSALLSSSVWVPSFYDAGILSPSPPGLPSETPSQTVGIVPPIGQYPPPFFPEPVVVAAFVLLGMVVCYLAVADLIQSSFRTVEP